MAIEQNFPFGDYVFYQVNGKHYFTSCDPHHDIYTFSYWQICPFKSQFIWRFPRHLPGLSGDPLLRAQQGAELQKVLDELSALNEKLASLR
jgi:hypothetical protein